jgi:LEA14-like dessication related protein
VIKKILLTVLLLFIAAIATFFIWRYVGYEHDRDPNKTFLLPRVELSDIEITSLTAEKTEMTLRVLIKNQIPLSFTADSLQYKLFINNVEVVKDHYKDSIKIGSNDSSWITLPITIFNRDLVSVLGTDKREHLDSVEYRLQLSFYTSSFFNKHFDLNLERLLPLVSIPEVKEDHIEIDSLNFSRAAIRLLVSVTNQNVFGLKAKNIAYQLSIENNEWIKGEIPGFTDIKAKSVTPLAVPVRLSIKEVGKTLFDLLKKGENVRYRLRLTFKMEPDNNMMKNSSVIIESEGTVKSLIKL